MAFYATIKMKGPSHLQRYKIGDDGKYFSHLSLQINHRQSILWRSTEMAVKYPSRCKSEQTIKLLWGNCLVLVIVLGYVRCYHLGNLGKEFKELFLRKFAIFCGWNYFQVRSWRTKCFKILLFREKKCV